MNSNHDGKGKFSSGPGSAYQKRFDPKNTGFYNNKEDYSPKEWKKVQALRQKDLAAEKPKLPLVKPTLKAGKRWGPPPARFRAPGPAPKIPARFQPMKTKI
jgi:hypothetical protein